MLTLQDCIALSDLTEEEIDAIAAHEHLPEIIAAELGNYIVHAPSGVPMLKAIIRDDIQEAERHGDHARVMRLRLVLRHFIQTHPETSQLD
jgi:hypothetical protein